MVTATYRSPCLWISSERWALIPRLKVSSILLPYVFYWFPVSAPMIYAGSRAFLAVDCWIVVEGSFSMFPIWLIHTSDSSIFNFSLQYVLGSEVGVWCLSIQGLQSLWPRGSLDKNKERYLLAMTHFADTRRNPSCLKGAQRQGSNKLASSMEEA